MHTNKINHNQKPHLWYQLYWFIYVVWFFAIDATEPKYIIHSRLDDFIPFNEWFVFIYCSWFALLVAVLAALWWNDTASYDKLCLAMFSGMTFCLIVYMLLPNGLDMRPVAQTAGHDNIAMRIMRLIWLADTPNNVCPSIHCQSTACMALALSNSKLIERRPRLKPFIWCWGALICASTVFTKQHSIIDVVCGLALAAVWTPVFCRSEKRHPKAA